MTIPEHSLLSIDIKRSLQLGMVAHTFNPSTSNHLCGLKASGLCGEVQTSQGYSMMSYLSKTNQGKDGPVMLRESRVRNEEALEVRRKGANERHSQV